MGLTEIMCKDDYKTVMIMAGEASGDIHGADLARELKKIAPSWNLIGMGGSRMKEAGVQMVLEAGDIAVVGITEAFFKLDRLWKALRLVRRTIREHHPDLLILIDFPDFNLMAASYAKKCGVKVLYYISPQIWAWRSGRIAKIKRNVDKMAVILPFEEDLYRAAALDVAFVGHPLLDHTESHFTSFEAKRLFSFDEGTPVIALLPGSRDKEVKRHLPLLLKAGELINRRLDNVRYILPLAGSIEEEMIEPYLANSSLRVTVTRERVPNAVSAADLAIVASGTATLEVAFMNKPMVIIYRISWLSYLIGRLFIKVKHIGLVNIIAGKPLVPELIQERASPQEIASQAIDILSNKERRERMIQELSEVKSRLGRPGAAARTAVIAYKMIRGIS